MVTQPQAFSATEEELDLALQLLDTWGTNGVLKGENAKVIFNRSGLPHDTLRVIWGISDGNASGDLSKDEVAKALRLMGWAQTGERVHEGLLASGMCHSLITSLFAYQVQLVDGSRSTPNVRRDYTYRIQVAEEAPCATDHTVSCGERTICTGVQDHLFRCWP